MPPSGAPVALNPGLMFRFHGQLQDRIRSAQCQCPVSAQSSSPALFVLGMAVQPRLRPEAAG
jgi:hypothetical protein